MDNAAEYMLCALKEFRDDFLPSSELHTRLTYVIENAKAIAALEAKIKRTSAGGE